ncbi:MAG TPA: hypothetical protein VD863_06990 [Bradyrhizobium sp.]|nr:hypothetical protein [Bradyrhizobium sp.]
MSGRAQPVPGYPSKTAAVLALTLAGDTPPAIATTIGSTPGSVQQLQSVLRSEGKLPPKPGRTASGRSAQKMRTDSPGDTRGIWTPEKLTKARRIFGRTVVMVAEALQVPAEELLSVFISGRLPPVGKRQRLGQLLSGLQLGGAPEQAPAVAVQLALPKPALPKPLLPVIEPAPPTVTPSAAPVAATPQPDLDMLARAGVTRFRLRAPDGSFLNGDCDGMTRNRTNAWRGSRGAVGKVKRVHARLAAGLVAVRAD